jgi:hypothetical protein
VLTSAGTLMDRQKDWLASLFNLGTGFRLSDVAMQKQRGLAVRDVIEEMRRGNPDVRKFEKFSVQPEALPTLGPDEITNANCNRNLIIFSVDTKYQFIYSPHSNLWCAGMEALGHLHCRSDSSRKSSLVAVARATSRAPTDGTWGAVACIRRVRQLSEDPTTSGAVTQYRAAWPSQIS